jgi:hypothetical protein
MMRSGLSESSCIAEAGDAKASNDAPDPERKLRPSDPRAELDALASEQGVEPAYDFDALLGDFWPEDEVADEFETALRTWRREDGTKT